MTEKITQKNWQSLTIRLLFFSASILISLSSLGQIYSATDSVVVTSTNSYTSAGRGFKFTPNVNLNVTELGKRIPNTLGNYTWTIWNNNTNTIVHQQASTSNTATVYTYEPISSPVQLLQGVSYSLMLYCDATSGAQYYYGSSSQVNSNLTYTTAVYCNSCSPNSIAQGTVANFHYGTPDFHFTICNPGYGTDTRTECSGYTWINGVTYTSNNTSATHSIPGAAANGCDSIVTLNLTIIPTPIGIETQTACDSFLWIDGHTYTISTAVATHVLPGAAASGCDSIAKLNLTILNKKFGTDTRTECAGFTWIDGNSYYSDTNSAVYTIPGGASNGCDSVVTLNLTVNSVDVSTTVTDPTITANLSGASYQWLDCGNGYLMVPSATSQSFVPTTNGIYAAEITENGCIDTTNCITISTVELQVNENFNNIEIFPNPTNGEVNLNFGKLNVVELTIYSTTGKIIRNEIVKKSEHSIQLNEAPGVYFIELKSNDRIEKYKLVLQ